MPGRQIERSGSRRFVGQHVAVVFERRGRSHRKGERGLPIREHPHSSSSVLAYCDEVWLEDVAFFAAAAENPQRDPCCFVTGTVRRPPAADVTGKTGWSEIRLDVEDEGCFYGAASGACVRRATYVRLRIREIKAFGAQKGPRASSTRDLNPRPQLPTLGPTRRTWRGDMGGLNYEPATREATVAAVRWVLESYRGVVIVDGADDWNAPDYVRPEVLVERSGVVPVAWWHTGLSGQTRSGVVLTREQYERLCAVYREDFGCELEAIPGMRAPGLTRNRCGCWEGEGLAVYR